MHETNHTHTTAGLELQGVVKRFGDATVVQQMDLRVDPGEFVVLLGESGCGKSTTLRMIAGLETVTEGSIRIEGRDVTHLQPMARDIAMVFQNYALYPHMDVAQNMSFALELAGAPKAEITRRVGDAARILGIEPLLGRKPKELSGGQRQRVAIGRAIVREPKVFLFDEPLSNLDAKLRGHMRTELAVLHERLGKTTVYVTHDQVEAMTLASRIVIFDRGRIQQVGTPAEVFNHPANLFVAAFIGMPGMNLLDATLRSDGRIEGGGFALRIPQPSGSTVGEVVVGIRPQTLRIAPGGGTLEMEVKVVEYLGTESVLVGCLAGRPGARLTAMMPGQRTDLLHQRVSLEVDPASLHLFAKSSGLRLAR
ncbi:ABC transporter ATP-binding protein [Xylophilus sp. ASV27]|uniref:ABC transporter ATP-binding protein n=1 Tax=Xylophilus sp. ASV27 TaxID=2795129 RepID=UPI0018EBC991|nr:sn-glycerol-3-phosphate ABC transporter ATP-binding protein UgpC [Xylophilus sp. ASV27]